MNTSIKEAKALLLLYLVYFSERTSSHSENIAFFAISDEKECQIFEKELNVSQAELRDLADFLFKSGLVRFEQLIDTLFVFLTEKACDFVQKQNLFSEGRREGLTDYEGQVAS